MSEKKKKLVVGITAEGSVNLLLGQLAYFKERGYETYLMAPFSERSELFCRTEGCEHLVINIAREISLWKDLKTLWQIYKIFKKVKPDIVNLGTPKVSLLGMIAARFLGIRNRIYTCRGFRFEHETGVKRMVLIAMERITGFFADKIICISPSVEKLSHSQFIFSKKKTTVFKKGSSNGIDIKRFSHGNVPQQHIDKLKKELGIEDKFVFGFVGRLVDRKGIAEIYQAFSQLYSTNPSLRFLFVGSFENDQVTDKELQGKIINHPGILYVGPQFDVPLYLMLMDVFVLPAWWEGFGNVLVQAAAIGLPVISTKATGCIDAVSDGYNGILVKPKSLGELRDAMLLLYNDSNLRDVLGKNGIEWAKNFESRTIWSEMEKLYLSN